jgi:competence protein ComEA
MPRGSKEADLKPAWWIAFGVMCGLGAAGLVLLLSTPRRGQPIILVPAATAEAVGEVISPTERATADQRVNINTATAFELEKLPGIGPTLAQNIVRYREANGPFETLEELMNVPDIGPLTFEAIQFLITLGED